MYKPSRNVYQKTHTGIFIVALFIATPNWKQPRCPSTGKWINKLWDIHPTEHYSALQRHSCHVQQDGRNKRIMLSERGQTEKAYILCNSIYTKLYKMYTNV